MRKLITLAAIAAAVLPTLACAEDFVVIVNKANTDPVDRALVERVYRGEAKNWPASGAIVAVVLPESNALRAEFDKSVLGKTPAQTKTLWAQLTFSGKMVPPKTADDEAAAVKLVAEEKRAIGYVSAAAAGSAVKIVK